MYVPFGNYFFTISVQQQLIVFILRKILILMHSSGLEDGRITCKYSISGMYDLCYIAALMYTCMYIVYKDTFSITFLLNTCM